MPIHFNPVYTISPDQLRDLEESIARLVVELKRTSPHQNRYDTYYEDLDNGGIT